MALDNSTNEVLMGCLATGDASALESLYDRHGRLLYSLALRITSDSQVAEEVLQDTFLQLWYQSSRFDPGRGSLIAWLVTITRNLAISHVRRQRRHDRFRDQDISSIPYDSGSTVLEQHSARQLVLSALSALPETQQVLITLAYFDGLTCTELSVRTNTPLGTVKTRLRCALKSMKKVLSDQRVPARPHEECELSANSFDTEVRVASD
jgi:RNA polymerase sigma-70 factor, ECF subfamily